MVCGGGLENRENSPDSELWWASFFGTFVLVSRKMPPGVEFGQQDSVGGRYGTGPLVGRMVKNAYIKNICMEKLILK